MTWHAIEKPVAWRSIEKAEAALRRFHDSFPARTRAVKRYVDEMIAELRANPPGPPRSVPRLKLGEYEHPDTGEAMLDGLPHPGL
jgi:hypothetical protein